MTSKTLRRGKVEVEEVREGDPDGKIVVHHRSMDTLGKLFRAGVLDEAMHDAAREFQAAFVLARLDMLRVEAFAPLRYHDRLHVGQQVTVHPEAPVGGAYAGTITVIDRVFDAATATFGLRVALPNAELALPAGLRCELHFDS